MPTGSLSLGIIFIVLSVLVISNASVDGYGSYRVVQMMSTGSERRTTWAPPSREEKILVVVHPVRTKCTDRWWICSK